jgi:hypothetical protein
VGTVVDVVDVVGVVVATVELWMADIAAAVLEVDVVALVDGVALLTALAAARVVVWLARSATAAVPATPRPASTAVTARDRRNRSRRMRPESALARPLADGGVGSRLMATSVGVATQSRLIPVWEPTENPVSSP